MSTLLLCLALLAQMPPITYPAGAYTITTPGPTNISYTSSSVTFSWGAPGPTPPPPTPPPPTPPAPTPVPVLTGHVWAMVIYDPTVTLPPAQQAVLTSPTMAASCLVLDIDFQPHQTTDPAISTWLAKTSATGLPALLLIQKSATGAGALAYAVPLPGSEAEILAIMKQVRGQ